MQKASQIKILAINACVYLLFNKINKNSLISEVKSNLWFYNNIVLLFMPVAMLLYSAFTEKFERNCHFPAPSWNCMTQCHALQGFPDTNQVSLPAGRREVTEKDAEGDGRNHLKGLSSHENPRSGYPVSGPGFECETSRI
jgi:hypothetical protein